MTFIKKTHHISIIGFLVYVIINGTMLKEAVSDISPERTFELTQFDKITTFAVSNDGSQIFIGGYKKEGNISTDGRKYTGFLYSLSTGEKILEFDRHKGFINGAVFSSDGQKLLTSGVPYTAFLWNTKTSDILRTFLTNETPDQFYDGDVTSVAIFPDNERIALGDDRGNFQVFDSYTGEELFYLPWYESLGRLKNITILDNGSKAIISSNTSLMLSLENKKPDVTFCIGREHVAVSDDGKYVISVESTSIKDGRYLAYRDINTGELVKKEGKYMAGAMYDLASNASFFLSLQSDFSGRQQPVLILSSSGKSMDAFSTNKGAVIENPDIVKIVANDKKIVMVKDNILYLYDVSDPTSSVKEAEKLGR